LLQGFSPVVTISVYTTPQVMLCRYSCSSWPPFWYAKTGLLFVGGAVCIGTLTAVTARHQATMQGRGLTDQLERLGCAHTVRELHPNASLGSKISSIKAIATHKSVQQGTHVSQRSNAKRRECRDSRCAFHAGVCSMYPGLLVDGRRHYLEEVMRERVCTELACASCRVRSSVTPCSPVQWVRGCCS